MQITQESIVTGAKNIQLKCIIILSFKIKREAAFQRNKLIFSSPIILANAREKKLWSIEEKI